MHKLSIFILSLVVFTSLSSKATDVGVYYYPGWNRQHVDAWSKIKLFPEREPLLGWYKEGDDSVTKKQLQWMDKYNVKFIAYDWYWDKGTGTQNRTYAIDSYLRSVTSIRTNVKFTLLWANHTGTPESYSEFDKIVDYWIAHYFKNEKYLKIQEMPVVYIFSPEMLAQDAASFGAKPKELLDRARNKAIQSGLKGIYFIGSSDANVNALTTTLPEQSYNAISAYNYHLGMMNNKAKSIIPLSKSYPELTDGYEFTWEQILKHTKLPYVIPLTSGWDKRPWGGSEDSQHDNSYSTPNQFYTHLKEAKKILDANPANTLNTVIICCWNEYGEGSYIEPTKKYGFSYLEKISEVFKDK
ncbi:glycoside hydrolase family 99-like domain-containing protein [Serratia sp. JSRIV001]|uniref:glycoside hydrolase family 99-like domain-containing protein n=1 Tax=Serratia TaxID=613 RepID=UPI001CC073D8|nr:MULTISPECIES: glycoside hydrolase family 99-like domain-containing protein [Serratia]UAN47634.1 glycoside hydrolase family 99-like domain-containing protein [Serratia sp. JSRIV001]CAI1126514.1 Uncharacterised protein [Serratia fonticola]